MSNRYFDFPSSLSRFLRRTLARAEDVNARFDDVSAGFDTVQTEMDAKAPTHAPSLTGNVSIGGNLTVGGTASVASPGAVSVSNDLVPTTQWVQNVVGAASAMLPTQAGKHGMYLSTNGSFASWLVARTGVYQFGTGVVDVPPETELLDADAGNGVLFRLPDATTLPLHKVYHVNLRSNQGVMDYTGSLLYSGNLYMPVFVLCLTDNSTSAGVWRILLYTAINSFTAPSQDTDNVIAGVTYATSAGGASGVMVGDNRFLVCGTLSSVSRAVLLECNDLTLSLVQSKTVAAPRPTAAWSSTFQVGDGSYIHVWSANSSLYGRAITVSGNTVTQGADVLLQSVITGGVTQLGAGSDGSSVVVLFTNDTSVIALALTATGTTLNVGTPLTIYSPGTLTTSVQQMNAIGMGAGSYLVAGSVTASSVNRLFAAELSSSGTTLSLLGTVQLQIVNNANRLWVTKLTSTLALATTNTSNSATTPSARTISISGSGATINEQTVLGITGITDQVHCAVSPTLAVVEGFSSRQIVTIAGTSVTAGTITSGTLSNNSNWVRLSSSKVYARQEVLDVSESGSPLVISHSDLNVMRTYKPVDDVFVLPEDRLVIIESNGDVMCTKNRRV